MLPGANELTCISDVVMGTAVVYTINMSVNKHGDALIMKWWLQFTTTLIIVHNLCISYLNKTNMHWVAVDYTLWLLKINTHTRYCTAWCRVYPKNNAHNLCLCCILVLGNFTHILQGYFTGTGAITWLPQCQWSNPEKYGKIHHQNP